MGLARILNRLHRTSPICGILCETCSVQVLTNSVHTLFQNPNSIHNSLHPPHRCFIQTLIMGSANPNSDFGNHNMSGKAPDFTEADEEIGERDNPQVAAKEAERITRLLSKDPCSSMIECVLDNCGVEEVTPLLVLEVLKRLSNAGVLALGFFRWAEKRKGFEHTTDCYNALIESLGKIKQFNVIESLVSSMKSKGILTKDTFMLVIRRYARARKVREATETFERMEMFGLKPDSSDFNRFLNTLCKSRQVQHAQQVFDKMQKRRFDPDLKTYGILLEGWGQEQDLSKFNEVYQEMRAEGLEPDTVTYGIVISAYCKAKKYDDAVEKFNEMVAKNCEPSPHIYCTLISGLGSEKRLDEALEFFNMSKARGFALEAPTYNAVVGSYCSSQRFKDAFRVIDEMRRGGVGPNARTYDIVLHHLIKAQRTKEAYSLFQRTSKELGCEPEVGTYEIIVRMFCNEGRVDMAMKVWDQMKDRGILPGMHMFSTLINSLCHEDKLEDACRYLQEMLDMGIRPPGPMFSNLKEALLENGKKETFLSLARKLEDIRRVPIVP